MGPLPHREIQNLIKRPWRGGGGISAGTLAPEVYCPSSANPWRRGVEFNHPPSVNIPRPKPNIRKLSDTR